MNESVEHLGIAWIFVSRNLKYVLKIDSGTSTISIQIPMKIDNDALDRSEIDLSQKRFGCKRLNAS